MHDIEHETRTVNADGNIISYELTRKRVKNINLRITSDMRVTVSANKRVSVTRIDNFVISKSAFIIRALNKFSKIKVNEIKPLAYVSGERLLIFGEEYVIEVFKSNRNTVTLTDGTFTLKVKDVDDVNIRIRVAEKYLNNLLETTVRALCDKAYENFKSDGVAYPVIKFRRMTSRWGSCQMRKGILTFNYALISKPLKVIDYVVYHEFTHFLVPNHSKLFYYKLEEKFPDWRACRAYLKQS